MWLQIRMRDLARIADSDSQALTQQYWEYGRACFWRSVPAFIAFVGVYWLMVLEPSS
ncbi:DUF2269 family protein [Caballeronia sp. GAWG1-5s-s]|uniref:DUF2269 family protein n=1 Tax=Caballeronia sp. GAWG1-5s-s TaxID=2921743 RepID=UPI0032EAC07C